MADLLVRLTLSWINWLIGSLINLLFKIFFVFAALPTPTTSDCPRFKIVSGPHSGPLVAPSLNQLNNLLELKFNLLNDNPQRWPCGVLFCRLLVETCNSSTTEWYTCLNNQNCFSYFLWQFMFMKRIRYFKKSEKDEKLDNGKMVKECSHKVKGPLLLISLQHKKTTFKSKCKAKLFWKYTCFFILVLLQVRGRKFSSTPDCWRLNEIKWFAGVHLLAP